MFFLSVKRRLPKEEPEVAPAKGKAKPLKPLLDGSASKNDRIQFLRSIVGEKASSSRGDPLQTVTKREESAEPVVEIYVEFSLASLHQFATRNMLAGGGSRAAAKPRIRPNYDNRLRRLNKKLSSRIAHLIKYILNIVCSGVWLVWGKDSE